MSLQGCVLSVVSFLFRLDLVRYLFKHTFESPNSYAFSKCVSLLCNESFSGFHRGTQKDVNNSPQTGSKSPTAKTAMVRLGRSVPHLFSQHCRQKSTTPQRRTTTKISRKNLAPKVRQEKWGRACRSFEYLSLSGKYTGSQLCFSKWMQMWLSSSWRSQLQPHTASVLMEGCCW